MTFNKGVIWKNAILKSFVFWNPYYKKWQWWNNILLINWQFIGLFFHPRQFVHVFLFRNILIFI